MGTGRIMASTFWDSIQPSGWIASALLLLAMLPNMGSGFYVFLRWAIFAIAIVWFSYGLKFPRSAHLVVGVVAGALWNPAIPIYLERGVWFWFDLVFALAFLLLGNDEVPSRDPEAPDRRSSWR